MAAPNSTLFNMLAEDLNSSFLKQYAQRTNIIYKEAERRSFKDEAVHDAFKSYAYGQTRFTLHQSMFLKLADDCGVAWDIEYCPQNGLPSAVVKMGRFFFTDHYGSNSHEVTCLNASLMRKQNAAVNHSMLQGSLFEPAFDNTKLLKADRIYANFIHGCRSVGSDFALYGFMRVAVPCVTNSGEGKISEKNVVLVENHNLYDVLAAVEERENQNRAVEPTVNVAVPKLKVKK